MLRFKDSVRIRELTPVLIHILQVLIMCDKEFPEDMVVTSVNDSKHTTNSAHYRDEAVDIRCNDRPYNVDMALVARLKEFLGPKFSVLYEGKGTPNEHIHIQLRKGAVWTSNLSNGA